MKLLQLTHFLDDNNLRLKREVQIVKNTEISIIGAGSVGSTFAYSFMIAGLDSEIVIVDVNKETAEVMNLSQAAIFVKPINIIADTNK